MCISMHKDFQKSSKPLQILGTRIVTGSNFHTQTHKFGVHYEYYSYWKLPAWCM